MITIDRSKMTPRAFRAFAVRDAGAVALSTGAVALALIFGVGAGTLVASAVSDSANQSSGVRAETALDEVASNNASMTASAAVPTCAAGQLPVLQTGLRSRGSGGAATANEALRSLRPDIVDANASPWFGTSSAHAPVWFTTGSEAFIATELPDGTWVAASAKFVGCRAIPPARTRP